MNDFAEMRKERMQKRMDLIVMLEDHRDSDNEKLIDGFIDFLIDQECQLIAVEEALSKVDACIKAVLGTK